jgi:hypothetical protein
MADLGLTKATGIGPAMAYDLQWQMVQRIAGWIEGEQAKPKPKPNQRQLETLCDRMSRVLEKPLPYEKPRLAAITVKSDADDPPRTQLDLTVLTDAELDTMEKLCLKAATGHTADITSRKPPEPRRAATRR